MAACHFVADRNLSLLCDIDADDLVDPGREIVLLVAGEDLDIHDDTALTVRNTERGVADFSCLLAEDGAQQSLFCGKFGLALRRDLTDEDVARTDFRTDLDDTVGVQILQRVVADIRNLAGDDFFAELGIAGFVRVLLNVDRGVHIVADEALIEQDCVLVVVAFPGHEADQCVLAERNLTLVGCGAVGNDIALLHTVAFGDDRLLIDAGALVGALEFNEVISDLRAVVLTHRDIVRGDALDNAALLGKHTDAGVDSRLVLHTGADNRRVGNHQRDSLLLHVRAHEGTGVIVVFKERDHRGRNRDQHLRRDIDIVNLRSVDFENLGLVARNDAALDKSALGVERLVCLCDDVVVLDIRRHILDNVGDLAGCLIHLAIGRLDKAVIRNLCVGGEVGNQTDVRAFRRLDRAHSAVVRVVYVTNLEGRAVTRQTAGAERGQTALVRQLCPRVVLIHELRQRRRAEELADRRDDRADVDEVLRMQLRAVLHRHSLLDDLIHTGEADAQLVLQQLADAAHAAVAQVVDIVKVADTVRKTDQIVNGCENIILGNMLGAKLVNALLCLCLDGVDIAAALLQNLTEHGGSDLFVDAAVAQVKAEQVLGFGGVVGEDLDRDAVVEGKRDLIDTVLLNLARHLAGQRDACLADKLAREGVDGGFSQLVPDNASGDIQLLIIFIAADRREVVALGVKEQVVDEQLRALHQRRFARTELLVNLLERLLAERGAVFCRKRCALVLLEGRLDQRLVAEHRKDVRIGLHAERTDEHRDRNLSRLVDLDIESIGCVGLVLQPCASVRNHRRGVHMLAGLVNRVAVVDTG